MCFQPQGSLPSLQQGSESSDRIDGQRAYSQSTASEHRVPRSLLGGNWNARMEEAASRRCGSAPAESRRLRRRDDWRGVVLEWVSAYGVAVQDRTVRRHWGMLNRLGRHAQLLFRRPAQLVARVLGLASFDGAKHGCEVIVARDPEIVRLDFARHCACRAKRARAGGRLFWDDVRLLQE